MRRGRGCVETRRHDEHAPRRYLGDVADRRAAAEDLPAERHGDGVVGAVGEEDEARIGAEPDDDCDLSGLTGLSRMVVYRWFTEPGSRDVYARADHEERERTFVAELRGAYTRLGEASRAGQAVRELLATSPEFARRWAEHEVAEKHPSTKRFMHPEVGELTLDCQTLLDTETGQRLLVFTATPGTPDAEKLALLSVIGMQTMARAGSAR